MGMELFQQVRPNCCSNEVQKGLNAIRERKKGSRKYEKEFRSVYLGKENGVGMARLRLKKYYSFHLK